MLQNKINLLTIFLLAIYLIVSVTVIKVFLLPDYFYALLMCSHFLLILYQLWRLNGINPLFLFYATFSFLFIGGRFWAILFGFEAPLWYGTFFCPDYIGIDSQKNTCILILLFSYCTYMGALIGYGYPIKHVAACTYLQNEDIPKLNMFLRCVFCVLAPVVLLSSLHALKAALSGGYLTLYLERQNSEHAAGSGLILIFQYVLFGITMTYGNRYNKLLYLSLCIFTAFINILIGGRSAFGAFIMFMIWIYSQHYKVNLKKMVLIGGVGLVVLLLFFSFSVREATKQTSSLSGIGILASFFYDQGTSLAVFDQSRSLEDYPGIAYVQAFIPGAGTMYSLFSGNLIYSYHLYFAHYLSWTLNPSLFYEGAGLGWTFLGDIYLFSGRTIVGFMLLSFIFGCVCGYCESVCDQKRVFRIVQYTIFVNLMMLPRASLSSTIPLLVYTLTIYYAICFLLRIRICKKTIAKKL